MQKVIDVHIGEVKVVKNGQILKAILGSCVGIAVIWKKKGMCGLAHCLLAESPVMTFAIGGRFVDQATRSLVAMMKIRSEDLKEIEVVIVGGGNMTSPGLNDSDKLVGANNFKVALREAKKLGWHVVHTDGGGEEGRKIFVDSANCSYRIEKIPRIAEAV